MKKLKLTLIIINLFFSWVFANTVSANMDMDSEIIKYEDREHFDTFQEFYQSLPILMMPVDTKNLPTGKAIDSQFFHYDDDDYSYYDDPYDDEYRYFTLRNLKAMGRFQIDGIRFVLFSFTFDSEGEGFERDVYLLNAFNKNDEYLDGLFLSGFTGHEDHSFLFSSKIDKNLFQVHIEADYELGYVSIHETTDGERRYTTQTDLTYEFRDNRFWREKRRPNCQELNLKDYLNKIEKGGFADIHHVIAFNDYIACYPVSEYPKTYRNIAGYIASTRSYFLSRAEYSDLKEKLKIILSDD